MDCFFKVFIEFVTILLLVYVLFLAAKYAKSCPTFATLWTINLQVPLSMRLPKRDYWSGLPFPSPGDLPGPGIEPVSLTSPALAGRFFTTSTP